MPEQTISLTGPQRDAYCSALWDLIYGGAQIGATEEHSFRFRQATVRVFSLLQWQPGADPAPPSSVYEIPPDNMTLLLHETFDVQEVEGVRDGRLAPSEVPEWQEIGSDDYRRWRTALQPDDYLGWSNAYDMAALMDAIEVIHAGLSPLTETAGVTA